ncbi:L-asparaginase [Eubacterium aggregans]|uniref:asparaginase n=1 Tax=Eubacterium aggregans TaxID=81409 RepID=A0A1H4BH53_9FIRM|nr:asparaginase [Eubacterium aggregans]SEA47426.1 L-asparaginase [Eubacterium aggregans]
MTKKRITILATGGTIAGTAPSATQTSGYTAADLGVEALVDAIPELRELACIHMEQILQIPSQSMDPARWLVLVHRINALLAKPDVDGIVITHGTDTLEETAYFLNLTVKSNKPVVITGAMRPATALSADGPMNLYQAVQVAADPQAAGKGVLIVLNDTIHGARNVTKASTHHIEAFEGGELGIFVGGRIQFNCASLKRHTLLSRFDVEGLTSLPTVSILYEAAGLGDTLWNCAQTSSQGIVIAGMGNGSLGEGLTRKVAAGVNIPVVRSSRVGSGAVIPGGEFDDDRTHTIPGNDLNPQKARVLLMLALTQSTDPGVIRKWFEEY